MVKLRNLHNFMTLQIHPQHVFQKTVHALCIDSLILHNFFTLFFLQTNESEAECICQNSAPDHEDSVTYIAESELDHTLIIYIYHTITHYVCKFYFAEQMFTLKYDDGRKKINPSQDTTGLTECEINKSST